jgi:nitrogen regulatory protein P-II 2
MTGSNTHPMRLVTIVVEALAQEPLTRMLTEEGARGYTLFEVQGQGATGARVGDIAEFGNIQVEAVVQPEVAVRILDRLEREFFPRFATVAFEAEVRVLRPEKF